MIARHYRARCDVHQAKHALGERNAASLPTGTTRNASRGLKLTPLQRYSMPSVFLPTETCPAAGRRLRWRRRMAPGRAGLLRVGFLSEAIQVRELRSVVLAASVGQIQFLPASAANLKVMRVAPEESTSRKLSGAASGWRAATRSALALVVATASARLPRADVSLSTGTPCLSHSTANMTHLQAEDTRPGCGLNLLQACLVPCCT
jgi:hypothetical protein